MRIFGSPAELSVASQRRRKRITFVIAYGLLVWLIYISFRLSLVYGAPHAAGTVVLFTMIALALTRPTVALGAIVPLTIIGDPRAMPWWPVDKNLSSGESLLFTGEGLTIKPLEIMLFIVLLVVIVNQMVGRTRARPTQDDLDGADPEERPGLDPFLIAVLVLGFAVIGGVVWGLSRGGNVVAALLEAVAMVYIPMIFIAARMLFTTVAHYRRVLIAIVIAIMIESIHALWVLPRLRLDYSEGTSPLAHTAALQINMLFLALVATIVLRRKAAGAIALLTIASAPTLGIYIIAQRRSAIVAMLLGVLLLGVILHQVDRRRFKILAPIVIVAGVLYTGAFWNADGGVGIGAQTIRNIVAPDSKSYSDANSDLYRDIETFNLQVTIRSSPILGLGYGQDFLQPIPLPRIANFIFATISPHNAVLGLWFKAGLAGVLSYIFLISAGLAQGLRSILDVHDPRDRVVLFVFVANLPMTLVITFVEIAFDAPTTSVLGLSLALAATAPRLVARARREAGLPPLPRADADADADGKGKGKGKGNADDDPESSTDGDTTAREHPSRVPVGV